MPVFISTRPIARVGAAVELYSPWRRWFAWYPVRDRNVTFWLCWVEWRHVIPDGLVASRLPYRIPPRVAYRRAIQ